MTSGDNRKISSVALINLVLALVSLAKDLFLAGYLGTSAQADALLLAYFIVDASGNGLLGSAVGVAIIPVLAGLQASGEQQRLIKLARSLVVYSVVISTALAYLLFLTRFGLFSWVGVGLSEPSRQLSIGLFSILIPSLVVFPLINIGVSIMQVNNRFNIPALAPVLFNAVFLIGLIFLYYFNIPLLTGVYVIALFILISASMMLTLVWFPIIKGRLVTFSGCSKQRFLSSDLGAVWKDFAPYLLTLFSPQIVFMVERYLASHLETGSISGLNYAFRLVQFPLWVFIAAVSTVLFPALAKLSKIGDRYGFNKVLTNSIYYTSVFTIPFTILLFVLRVPIITILLQRGEFSAHSVVITANIMAGYTLTIIWQGFSVIWVRASLVEGKVFCALIAAAVAAFATISLDIILVPLLGAAGLGYGAAIGAIINFATLYKLFSRFSLLKFSQLWRGLFKILLANVPLLFVTLMFSQVWVRIAENGTLSSKLGYGMVVIIVCSLVYYIGLKLCGVKLGI